MKHYKIIGIMSGTSLDGLDIAYTQFDQDEEGHWVFKLELAETFPYESEMMNDLKNSVQLSGLELTKLDLRLGTYIGQKVSEFCQKNKLEPSEIDAIACHGQTVFHQPENRFSLQIGSGTAISIETGIPVINQFRSKDIYLGGQGAPLVPIGDFELFRNQADAYLNIGGIANISFVKGQNIQAFDICPGNLVLNKLVEQKGFKYDDEGKIARNGELNFFLLDLLNELDYYKKPAPKSLGTEWLEREFYPLIKWEKEVESNLRTLVEHAAFQIAEVLNSNNLKSVFITGGGAFNLFLIERIQHYYKGKIIIPTKNIIEFKEALIFGFLGVLYLEKKDNCLKSVTGSSRNNCGGVLHIPH